MGLEDDGVTSRVWYVAHARVELPARATSSNARALIKQAVRQLDGRERGGSHTLAIRGSVLC